LKPRRANVFGSFFKKNNPLKRDGNLFRKEAEIRNRSLSISNPAPVPG
jgi:hypothetical protein